MEKVIIPTTISKKQVLTPAYIIEEKDDYVNVRIERRVCGENDKMYRNIEKSKIISPYGLDLIDTDPRNLQEGDLILYAYNNFTVFPTKVWRRRPKTIKTLDNKIIKENFYKINNKNLFKQDKIQLKQFFKTTIKRIAEDHDRYCWETYINAGNFGVFLDKEVLKFNRNFIFSLFELESNSKFEIKIIKREGQLHIICDAYNFKIDIHENKTKEILEYLFGNLEDMQLHYSQFHEHAVYNI
ncbi:hypothetical protein EXQ27_09855 [Clostridium botulinum]|nr:hypothetical protein [Clostridium botulinum]MBO0538925.1 hypothetical protein [Clostridium botulinum]